MREEGRDKRMESIPLKLAIASSQGSGKTILHRIPTATPIKCKVHLLPWYPAQAAPFMSVKMGRERETSNMLVSPAVGAETDMRVPVFACMYAFVA